MRSSSSCCCCCLFNVQLPPCYEQNLTSVYLSFCNPIFETLGKNVKVQVNGPLPKRKENRGEMAGGGGGGGGRVLRKTHDYIEP